jgi:putative membrane protein
MHPDIQAFASPEIQAFANGFPVALLQAAVTLAILLAGVMVHALLTPHKDVGQIRAGNAAAAVSLGGVMLGLALPLSRSLSASTSVIETAIWGLAVGVLTLLIFRLIDMLLKGLPQRVQEGDVSAAALLVAAKLAAALVIAAAFSG